MRPTTLQELEWLHDGVVLSVAYDTSSSAGRSLRIAVRCAKDCGYPLWEGKELVIIAVGVAAIRFIAWGWIVGPETLDQVQPNVSDALRDSTVAARRMGVNFPDMEFSIFFHSGSEIEIICRDLQVEEG